jgi:hypothetical protein
MLLNKKGVSMLYVLMALVCVGAMGSLVLSMAKKEKADSSLRYSSELARYGATSGLVLAVNEPLKTEEFANLMDKWYKFWKKADKYEEPKKEEKWLKLGDGYDYSNGKYYEDKNNNNMKYRARVVNADFTNVILKENPYINLMIECESIDKSGSRAKNVAFYKVYGFEDQIKSTRPKSALYMGGGMDEINTPLTVTGISEDINGDTFLRGSANINVDGNEFGNVDLYKRTGNGGEFRLNLTNEGTAARVLKGSNFYGPAYFGANGNPSEYVNMETNGKVNKFFGRFGLDDKVALYTTGEADSIYFYESVYLRGKIGGNSNDNANKWKFLIPNGLRPSITEKGNLYYSNTAIYLRPVSQASDLWDLTSNESEDISTMFDNRRIPNTDEGVFLYAPENKDNIPTNYSENIFNFLKIDKEPPPEIDIDTTGFSSMYYDFYSNNLSWGTVSSIKASQLNNAYASAEKNDSGWMFIKFDKRFNYFSFDANDNETFNGKMVLVIDTEGKSTGTKLFKSASNSNCLILVENGTTVEELGNNGKFRGLIVKRGAGANAQEGLNIEATSGEMNIEGAVYCVKSGLFRLQGTDKRIRIKYDPIVLDNIMNGLPGVVKVGEDPNAEPTLKPITKTDDVYAKQLNRLF